VPLVSIIMNCHNSSQYLSQALDSVYQQTFADYEIIFWDNVSTDNSAEIALSYGEPLRYFRGNDFLPLGAARSKAVAEARGKYIALLDCDDIWLPEKLEKQVALFESDADLALVYSDCYFIDALNNIIFNSFSKLRPYAGDVFFNLIKSNFIICPSIVFKKTALEEAGGFRNELQHCEEWDLCLRIALKHKVSYIPVPLAMYRKYEGNMGKQNWERAQNETLEVLGYNLSLLEKLSPKEAREIRWYLISSLLRGTLLTHIYKKKFLGIKIIPKLVRDYLAISRTISDKIKQ